jgi:hypothetical protein
MLLLIDHIFIVVLIPEGIPQNGSDTDCPDLIIPVHQDIILYIACTCSFVKIYRGSDCKFGMAGQPLFKPLLALTDDLG